MDPGTELARGANGKRTDIVSQFYSELFRIGAAAGDLGIYGWACRLYAMPGLVTVAIRFAARRRRPDAPTQ
jgi:hypothetical protein